MRNLLSAPPTSRIGRYPKHAFNVKSRPFQIRPFMLAPVLPGETMKTAYMESRVITDPIVNSIIGWKKEYFFFYVKMSDLQDQALRDMFIDPENGDIAGSMGIAADDNPYYTAKGGINWSKKCMARVVTHYFRDEGETWDERLIDGLPVAQIKEQFYLDSITDDSQMPAGDDIEEATNARDLEALQNAFEMLRAMGLSDMTYEDYLRSHGIAAKDPTEGKPELIWHMSDFQYPSNTIDPTNGTPRSAVSWVFKQSNKGKPKLFKEPGFVFGVTVTRPKVYFGGLFGSGASHMSRAWDWMPAMMAAMPETRLKHFDAGTGPLGDRSGSVNGTESEYWLDMCDILIHGDQWIETPLGADLAASRAADHAFALPNWGAGADNLATMYLGNIGTKEFFVDGGGTKYHIREDGFVSLGIAGKQVDLTNARTIV